MKRRKASRLLLAGLGAVVGASLAIGLWPGQAMAAPTGDPSLVRTANGRVQGTVTDDYRQFQAIPFAAPPVGALRWASPQPAKSWTGVRDATKPADSCAQLPGLLGEQQSESEDCLYLTVTTPRRTDGRPLPVVVWIPGGDFRNGASSSIQPTEMAEQGNVIVVTVNYRLGLFGFLDLPELDGGLAAHKSGNFGLEDQQAALRWVQRNVGAFGGDARNVTLAGESAGGVSACAQLTAPTAAGLFQRAILQSAPCTVALWPNTEGTPEPDGIWLPRSRTMAEQQGAGVAKELGCTDPATMVACLRSKSASTLLPLSDYGFGPVYGGGGLLPLSPKEALSTGKFNRVPVLNGSTRDEYRMFAAAFEELGRPPMTAADYLSQVDTFTGSNAAAVLARYPLSAYGSPSEAWSALVTDAVFSRSQSDVSQDLSARVPTYSYEFADRNAPWVNGLPKPSFPTGAFHVAELAYLFQTQYVTDPSFTPAQQQLSDTMIQYWTTFARFGNPNSLGAPCWPRSNGTVAQVLAPDAVALVNFATEHNYSFWQTVFP